MTIHAEKTVGQLVAENPAAARVFEKAGIDYCCGGHRSLGEACKQGKMPLEQVSELLEKAAAERGVTDRDWMAAGLSELVDHIVNQHHAYVRQELPRLQALIEKVNRVHGKNHPELKQMAKIFEALADEMTMHMMKEEQILFPYIAEMEQAMTARGVRPIPMFGTVRNPVRMMMMEHDSTGTKLRTIRQLSADYRPPADACTSYRVLYEAMADFEADLHQHVHLENNILFPRAVEMENRSE